MDVAHTNSFLISVNEPYQGRVSKTACPIMADNGKARNGVPLSGRGAYDQDIYGEDAAYDTAIGFNETEDDDEREKLVAR